MNFFQSELFPSHFFAKYSTYPLIVTFCFFQNRKLRSVTLDGIPGFSTVFSRIFSTKNRLQYFFPSPFFTQKMRSRLLRQNVRQPKSIFNISNKTEIWQKK